jgi:hypothetical protein
LIAKDVTQPELCAANFPIGRSAVFQTSVKGPSSPRSRVTSPNNVWAFELRLSITVSCVLRCCPERHR